MEKRQNAWYMNLGTSLFLVWVLAAWIKPVHHQPGTHVYLEKQAAALQPAFRGDLEMLADAPRYSIEASVNPEGGLVTGQMSLQYTNTSQATLSELVFRLYPNAQTIYGGGGLTVDSVTQAGTPRESVLSEDRTILRVPLEQRLKPGQAVWLDLTFTAQVPVDTSGGYGIFNRALGVLSLAGWYPVLATHDRGWQTAPVPRAGDALLAETSLYQVALTLPAGYQVVSTGTTLERENHAKEVTWHLVSGPAREFAVAISNRFQVLETRVDDVTLRLHTLPASSPVVYPGAGLAIMTDAFEAFVNRFGPYPFNELDLVEAAVSIDGYEFSGMVYVDYAVRTQETLADYRYVVAHEVAHQWWYGLVGNHTVDEPWLDEALATYAAAVYLEDTYGPQSAENLLAFWRRIAGTRRPQDPPLNSSALDFSNWGPYHKAVYTYGALFHDQLREELGDEEYFALLRKYQATYRYRLATTADFLYLAQEVADQDLSAIYEAWFDTYPAYGHQLPATTPL